MQRFMHLHPERLRSVGIGAPGTVTSLDEGLKWPGGVGDLEEIFGAGTVVRKDVSRKLLIQLVVGGEDNAVHGGDEFWEWLEEKKKDFTGEKGSSMTGSTEMGRIRMGRLDALIACSSSGKRRGSIRRWMLLIG